MERHLLAVFL